MTSLEIISGSDKEGHLDKPPKEVGEKKMLRNKLQWHPLYCMMPTNIFLTAVHKDTTHFFHYTPKFKSSLFIMENTYLIPISHTL
jgi:hypothetical protein